MQSLVYIIDTMVMLRVSVAYICSTLVSHVWVSHALYMEPSLSDDSNILWHAFNAGMGILCKAHRPYLMLDLANLLQNTWSYISGKSENTFSDKID